MKSHANPSSGATYELEGLPGDLIFNIEYLKWIKTHAQRIHFNYNTKGMAVFFGDGVRGAIARINRWDYENRLNSLLMIQALQ